VKVKEKKEKRENEKKRTLKNQRGNKTKRDVSGGL
jgi:hypothetical protein